MMSFQCLFYLICVIGLCLSYRHHYRFSVLKKNKVLLSSNSDIFSNSPTNTKSDDNISETIKNTSDIKDEKQKKMMDEAAKLRREAAELEVSLREEARAKGLPEEMINKLIPLTSNRPAAVAQVAVTKDSTQAEIPKVKLVAAEIRSKLGYLNIGDPVRMTTELDRIKSKGIIKDWNSKSIITSNFAMNNLQLKTKTNIEPVNLKLDDVGYNYQNVFIIALGSASAFAVGSSFIGGQLGFILGYLSALFPVTLVGIGSIAPGLLGDAINNAKFLTNSTAKEKYIRSNAGKFLAGYVLGLPVSKFSTIGQSNTVEFFQIRPSTTDGARSVEEKQMFARNKFKQLDIACSSIVSLAGPVAECIAYGEAGGTNANDVNTLYELMRAIDPPLSPDKSQDHIRWSAVNAYEILNTRKAQLDALTEAFSNNLPLEECISILEEAI